MKKTMKLKAHLEKAYGYIAKLQVSGDAVDLVAMVRIEMRNAWAAANELEKKELMENENTDTPVRERDPKDPADTV